MFLCIGWIRINTRELCKRDAKQWVHTRESYVSYVSPIFNGSNEYERIVLHWMYLSLFQWTKWIWNVREKRKNIVFTKEIRIDSRSWNEIEFWCFIWIDWMERYVSYVCISVFNGYTIGQLFQWIHMNEYERIVCFICISVSNQYEWENIYTSSNKERTSHMIRYIEESSMKKKKKSLDR